MGNPSQQQHDASSPISPQLAEQALHRFLSQRRVHKGDEFTHTGMGGGRSCSAGSYYISASDQEDFHRLYREAVNAGAPDLSLTKKHRHIGPVVIDLDLRLDSGCIGGGRASPDKSIVDIRSLAPQICKIYLQRIREFVDAPHIRFFVMSRSKAPMLFKSGVLKDGLHIIVPDIVTRTEVQYLLRQKVLDDLSALFSTHITGLLSRIEDVVDEAVIEKNYWMMYGSRKPGATPYTVHSVLEWESVSSLAEVPIAEDEQHLSDILSRTSTPRAS
eukprot:gene31909-biopygen5712